MSNISSDRKNLFKVITAISTPAIESKIIRAFVKAEWNISERLFDLNNFIGDNSKELILIITPDQKSTKELHATLIVGVGIETDERWKRLKPDLVISPDEVETLPLKLIARMDEANCEDVIVGAKEILFLGSKGSPGTSTIAWNYAGELARSGQKILLAEENIDGAEGALFFGFDDQCRDASIFTAITIRPNYDLLCNPLVRTRNEITTPQNWAELRRKCQEKYSQIVIDGGVFDFEEESLLQQYFLCRAEKIFLIGQDNIFSLLRLKLMVDYVQDLNNAAKITIVVNKSKANAKSNLQIKNQLALSGDSEILFLPRADRLFVECVRDGVLISEVKGSKAASQLALMKRLHS